MAELIYHIDYDEVCESFNDMELEENLLTGICAYGFEKPTAVQHTGIALFCKGLDVTLQTQSKTGKTTTFCIGILQQLCYGLPKCQALVLTPTEELAHQIKNVMLALGGYLGVKVHACLGRTGIHVDLMILSSSVHVVVGTPGVVLYLLQSRFLQPYNIRMVVLDEADEMLSNGYKNEIYNIFHLLPSKFPKIQVGVSSVTMPLEALEITQKFMNKPARILAKRDELTLEGVNHFYADSVEEWKLERLCDLYKKLPTSLSVVFVNTKRKVDWLTDSMRNKGHRVLAISGDMDPKTSDIILKEFVSSFYCVLITTDILARGMDVLNVPLIINFDLPTQPENYLDRIGRSVRFRTKSTVINFVTRHDKRMLFDIQKFYNVVVEALPDSVLEWKSFLFNHIRKV